MERAFVDHMFGGLYRAAFTHRRPFKAPSMHHVGTSGAAYPTNSGLD